MLELLNQLPSININKIMNVLLKDRTTRKNILWATSSYEKFGNGFHENDEITILSISHISPVRLEIRATKKETDKKDRTKARAEVMTPSWISNYINNTIDEDWFGYPNVFNIENPDHSWDTTISKIKFTDKKRWEDYIYLKKIEITCGEAPFLVSRYDPVTGDPIPLIKRIGALDRKLRIINENIQTEELWFQWVKKAYQNTYGYEFQGDNLLIARINFLFTFIDNYKYKWSKTPDEKQLHQIALIISWNLWQMNGLTNCSPYTELPDDNEQLSIFTENYKEPIRSKVFNWKCHISKELKNKKGEIGMKFDYAIGNPPYQQNDGGAFASASPVYQYFIKAAYNIANNIVMIIPSRWMTGGKGLDEFRNELIHSKNIKILYDFADSKEIFNNVDIKGGVCILFQQKNYTGECECHRISLGKDTVSNRFLCDKDDDIFIREPMLINIKNRVFSHKSEKVSRMVSPLRPYGLRGDTMRDTEKYGLPKFSDIPIKDGYSVLGLIDGKNRGYKYINKDYPFPKKGYLNQYKIFVPRAYGCGTIGEVPSTPVLGTPVLVCTETFLEIGPFTNENDALNFLKYLKSKFFRTLVSIQKQTQDASSKVYQYVPIQDFTDASDIDWSKSIPEIDQQLYEKYGLDEKEIEFIETHVKEME